MRSQLASMQLLGLFHRRQSVAAVSLRHIRIRLGIGAKGAGGEGQRPFLSPNTKRAPLTLDPSLLTARSISHTMRLTASGQSGSGALCCRHLGITVVMCT